MARGDQVAGTDLLTERFEADRERLRAVALRMLGTPAEADDAVQEAWLRLNRTDVGDVDNLSGWLTTVTSRVCLDMLRSRRTRHERPLPETDRAGLASTGPDPEQQAVMADSVGVALLVVLDRLTPEERLSFVLHDLFAVPFDEIASALDRSSDATRQLASRARRKIRGATAPEGDLAAQRRLVDAFLAASREGRFDDLLALLAPEVTLHADQSAVAGAKANAASGAPVLEPALLGARSVATAFSGKARAALPALVDGVPGAAWVFRGAVRGVFTFEVADGAIAAVEVITDEAALSELDIQVLAR